MNLKTRLISGLSGLFFCTSIFAIQTLDSIIVIVNDGVITQSQLDDKVTEIKQQIRQKGSPIPDNQLLSQQVLEQMIVERIQLQMAEQQGIRIDDLSLNSALQNIASRNKIALDSLRKQLEREGISFEDYRERIRHDLMIQQLQQRTVMSKVNVSDEEINQLLEQQQNSNSRDRYHLAHILIPTPEAASPEDIRKAYDKAEQAMAHLKDGEAFHEVALRFSSGSQAINGGDLGWRDAGQLPILFLEALKQMNKGDSSSPLRSTSGFHIIKLLDQKSQKHIVEQTHARHILMRADAITTEDMVRKTMNSIKRQLDKGADFAKLAAKYSQDPGSKNNEGDLGWASEGQFVPQFEKVMNSLAIKQISEPFQSQFGWHILQVLERRQQDETQQLMRNRAMQSIQQRKADDELQLWIRRIRDESYIEYHKS
ncbi:MAG: peptidylprolyl isomerase [Gammaproteobacteria bacterium]|nr:peptidylprolyl isomerase [Gammaproteobacteria bacterium]